jgi:excisionase family DNA binding protein
MTSAPDFYLVDELAEKLRVNPMTIYRYIAAGKLTAVKIGKEYRIDRKTFDDFIAKRTTGRTAE